MGTVYLRSTTAPDGTYVNRNAVLSHADMDNNLQLFLRNDVSDTMNGNLTISALTGLGTTAGNTLKQLSITGSNGNANYLDVSMVRTAAGSAWTSAGTRIQVTTDSTKQAFIEFNGLAGDYGIGFGVGSNPSALVLKIAEGGEITASDTTFITGTSNQLVCHAGTNTPSFIIRNDGGNTYFLLTPNNTQPNTAFNTLRPLYISNSTAKLYSLQGQYFNGGTELGRENSSNEGGQLQFNRASDDTVSWYIDVFGTTADTSLRLFNASNTSRMLELSGYGGTENSLRLVAHGVNAQFQCGSAGQGAVSLTLNDGYGNANIAFNHLDGVPDKTGSSARIVSSVDNTTGTMAFQVTSSTTQGVAVALTEVFKLIPGTASVSGALTATGNITAYSSDERLKENVKPIKNALEKLHNISGVTFDWKDECEELGFVPVHKKNDAGVIAQRVQEVLPQAVAPAPFDIEYDMDVPGRSYSKSGEDYLTVQYDKLTPLLIEAVKEQQTIIDSQQAQIDELRQMIMDMKSL